MVWCADNSVKGMGQCRGVLPYVPFIRAGGVGFGDLSQSNLSLLGHGYGRMPGRKLMC